MALNKGNNIHYLIKSQEDIQLPENHVDVWLSSLDIEETSIDKLLPILSEDELSRAERFHSIESKNKFIVARAFIRYILAQYLKIKPEEIKFKYDINGKPSLSGELSKTGLCFNVSHSHGKVLCGITMKRAIGIDIEKIRLNLSYEKITKRQFSPPELEKFQQLPENEKVQTFFTFWTRKESFLKAIRKGLQLPMKNFDVSNAPMEPVTFINDSEQFENTSEWFIEDLDICPGFCAALTIESQRRAIKMHNTFVI